MLVRYLTIRAKTPQPCFIMPYKVILCCCYATKFGEGKWRGTIKNMYTVTVSGRAFCVPFGYCFIVFMLQSSVHCVGRRMTGVLSAVASPVEHVAFHCKQADVCEMYQLQAKTVGVLLMN